MPDFLCGLRGENLYPAVDHDLNDRCPNCVRIATEQGHSLGAERPGTETDR